ncbi:MAG TPA: serine/threonine-protein kinase [Vicinamibacterales bacterium]|jgi:serine/threonine protein kinase
MLDQLGHYKILDRIGSGGLGDVYRARDTRAGRTVAVKVPGDLVADAEMRQRLIHDAQAATSLSHPNIATLYEVGEDDGRLFLALEFVPGEPLGRLIAGHPLNPRRAIQFAIQIADALADAHAAGILHQDIRPENIVITPKGNAKILDFGLAAWTTNGRARETASTSFDRRSGEVARTLLYASPEQARGEPIDERTDLFSLGIVLFEMLTGRTPFRDSVPHALRRQIVTQAVPRASSSNRTVPADLDAALGKVLEKRAEKRFESAATFAAALRQIDAALEQRTERAEPAVEIKPLRPVRAEKTFPWWLVALAAGGIAAAAAAWFLL